MDISELRVPLREAVKISKLDNSPKCGTSMGCNTCEAYALHVVKASKVPMVEIPPRKVKKAFQTVWPNIVHHIEDEASSESDKKVEWYSDCHDNLTDDLRLAEEKASAEQDHRQKADKS